jgi:predicted PurR-regulated permease PerM
MLDSPRDERRATEIPGEMDWDSARRTFTTALLWVLAAFSVFLLWEIRYALLIAFGAILVALLLMALADLLCRFVKLPRAVGLTVATLLVLAIGGITVWLFGAHLYSQFGDLLKNLKSGETYIRQYFEGSGAPDVADKVAEKGSSMLTTFATQAFQLGLGFVVAMVVVLITGIYLAAQPKVYRWGIAALFHPLHRAKVLQVIDLVETTVRYWLLGQIILMIIVGLLTYGALIILGIPSPVALAMIAGIAEIVPYLGPFIGAVPALLVALTIGVVPAMWTAGAYLLVHLIEGYIAAPLVERKFITIPPALILLGLVVVELIFGTGGVILAAPITVVAFVLVKMRYVDDPLEQEEDKKPA